MLVLALDIVSYCGKTLLPINYETRCSKLLYVYLALADVYFRERESIENSVNKRLLVFMGPNEFSLKIGTKHQLAFINELVDVCDGRVGNAWFNLQRHKEPQFVNSFSMIGVH